MYQISEMAEKVESRMFRGNGVTLQSQSALLRISGSRSLVSASGGIEIVRERDADVLRIGIRFLAHCGNGIIAGPSVAEAAQDVSRADKEKEEGRSIIQEKR